MPDALGSVRQVMTSENLITLAQSFDPFGNLRERQGNSATAYGYASEWADASGLINLRARYYDPAQGRFLTRDPFPGLLSQPATLQPYQYVVNNPVLLTDPSGEIAPLLIIAGIGFAAGAISNAYQQTNGFTDFCRYDILETLAWGVGGAAAASSIAIMAATGLGMVGLGLQGIALNFFGLGITSTISTSLWISGTMAVGSSSVALTWLFTSQSTYQPVASTNVNSLRLLTSKAGPVANISPSEVINRTPQQIHNRALQLGLEPRGKDPMAGFGSYIDPQTKIPRILVHPFGQPFPHAHVNNALNQRIDAFGNVVARETEAAHLLINFER